ncbi:MAG TPA: hypothetical protein VLB27_02985, partial [candidate division Zixibacteria bacterium]|nr:hypothetical protein [candidate division Zixibacteria bacterium]
MTRMFHRQTTSTRHSRIAPYATAALLAFSCGAASVAQAQSNEMQERIYHARDRALPALVHIQPVVSDYRTGKLQKQSVVGSGVVIHPDGYVVTNYHVAGKADHILCTLSDNE